MRWCAFPHSRRQTDQQRRSRCRRLPCARGRLDQSSGLFSAVGLWLGYPLADPIIGLLITATILPIVWESGKAVFGRLLDGVDPEVIDEITHAINHTQGARDITEVRLRWSGHRYTF